MRERRGQWFVVGGTWLVAATLWTLGFTNARSGDWIGLLLVGCWMIGYGTIKPHGASTPTPDPDLNPGALFGTGLLLIVWRIWVTSVWPLDLVRWSVELLGIAFLVRAHLISNRAHEEPPATGRTTPSAEYRRDPGGFNLPL